MQDCTTRTTKVYHPESSTLLHVSDNASCGNEIEDRSVAGSLWYLMSGIYAGCFSESRPELFFNIYESEDKKLNSVLVAAMGTLIRYIAVFIT